MTFGQLVALVRELMWPAGRVDETWSLARDASIVKNLWRRFDGREIEAMIRGAHLLGWRTLRGLNSNDGLGRRWAQAAWWQHVNQRPRTRLMVPQPLKEIFREMGR